MHAFFGKNEHGRDFIVGDIHGCYDLLIQQLEYVGFNYTQDRLISVGDLIDRGPESVKCLSLLDEAWFQCVRGNHEQMMAEDHLFGTGYPWRSEFGYWANSMTEDHITYWAKRILSLPIAATLSFQQYQIGICHAEPDGLDWKKSRTTPASKDVMMWGRKVLRSPPGFDVEGVAITIHGHTPLDKPRWVGNRYFLDTGAWETGNLTVRKIDDIFDEYRLMHIL